MAGFKIQQDSNPVLPKGFATPYVAIFNSQLSVIRDPESNIPIGSLVTHFEYTYDEEKIDKGKIEIETDNPDLVSLTELSYGMGLQLQWGYIYDDGSGYYSPVRKVIITNSNPVFSQSGIKLTLEFSDSSILLKNTPSNYFDNTKGFVKYIEDLCKGVPIGIAFIDYDRAPVSMTKPEVVQRVMSGEEIAAINPKNSGLDVEWSIGVSRQETVHIPEIIPEPAGVKFMEYNAETQKLTIEDPDNFRKVYLEQDYKAEGMIIGTSRNKYYQLQDVCRSLNGGPFFVDSRDDQIVVHNVKSQRNITKVYTYKGGYGELLEFSVKSDYIKTSVEVKQSTEINPDTKDINTDFVQALVDPNQGNPDSKDIDAFMVWQKEGFNPWDIKSPSSPQGSKKSGSSIVSPEYHVMLDPEVNAKVIKAAEEKPITKTRFNSISEARKYYLMHPEAVSQAEIDEYFKKWASNWRSKNTATDASSLSDLAHELDRIPPMSIERELTIRANVDIEKLGGSLGLRNAEVTRNRTESFVNSVLSGQIDLNGYDGPAVGGLYATPEAEGIRHSSMIMGGTYRKNAEAMLSSIPGVIISNPNNSVRKRVVIFKTKVLIEMNGVDVVSGADTINLSGVMGNDILEKVTNKVKANARVIGDPILESSMNIQIQNVSSKFTGLWYTKKVTHTIDSGSGYLCDIEFVQRSIPVSTITLKSSWSKGDYGKQVLSAIKQAAKTGEYKKPSYLERKVKNHLKDFPTQSYVLQRDPTTGAIVESKLDMVSGTYIRKTDGAIVYNGNSAKNYVRDLQNQVDKLK